ncbi:tankyrase-1-like isoform X2 [Varroa jacobsoni]|uniref:SOCS box domain-containing protein n=1 Tax=Varroa destructor TaxID=109461 RepID=A0A7M7IYN7_VARDE|nr:tankyrase-1-like isoform X2 [Varroa destructor]XP_022703182.1 tankyrase-1-like isoform X2 [Varroa jacobsoni]
MEAQGEDGTQEVDLMKDLDMTGLTVSKDRTAARISTAATEVMQKSPGLLVATQVEVMNESVPASRRRRQQQQLERTLYGAAEQTKQEIIVDDKMRRLRVVPFRPPSFPLHRYFVGAEINLISPLALSYMELLLRYGADPNSKDRTGLTPLMKACRHPQGYDAVELLIKFGADVNAMAGERHDYRSVLHYAVLSSNMDTVKLILSKGTRVNMSPSYRYPSPLDFAVLRANIELIRLLLDWGAEINTGSPIVGSPLHIALSEHAENSKEIVQLLLDHGADPNFITYTDDDKPFLKPPIGEYFLSTDSFRGHVPREDIIRILLKYGAKIVMTLQTQDNLGILKTIQNVQEYPEIIDLVLECCDHNWSPNVVRRSAVLTPNVRDALLEKATTPQTLKQQCRVRVRHLLSKNAHKVIQKIAQLNELPTYLKQYLLYEV